MKRLIICCDGTWNTPDMEDSGIVAPTNVFKFYNLASQLGSDGIEQRKYYQPGVGTDGFLDSIFGGAFGAGLDNKINDAYLWLGLNYEPGDEIFIIGFSRGAFVARCLAGYLSKGLPNFRKFKPSKLKGLVNQLYAQVYRPDKDGSGNPVSYNVSRVIDNPDHIFPGNSSPDRLANISHPNYAIKTTFLGVWDTVGSLGIPDDKQVFDLFDRNSRWEFHNRDLGHHVDTGRHAIGIDEIRSSFTVTHWSNVRKHKDSPRHPDICETWFPGPHCDVGGGYADESLSSGTLLWMMREASFKGVEFVSGAFDAVEALYNPLGELHNSFKGPFALLPARPRNIPPLRQPPGNSNTATKIHPSVFQRQNAVIPKFPKYRPTTILDSKQRALNIPVFAENRWNNTGIYLEAGLYYFTASGLWMDGADVCDWKGTQDGNFTTADIARSVSSLWGKVEDIWRDLFDNQAAQFALTKRIESFDWFRLVGCISNDQGVKIGDEIPNDGSPIPHQYVDLTIYSKQQPLKVKHAGYLYAFANDAWGRYENNDGIVNLSVYRL